MRSALFTFKTLAFAAILFFISCAIAEKDSATFTLSLAEVSMNCTPRVLASSWPSSEETARVSTRSALLPMMILFTFSEAYFSISLNQLSTLSKLVLSVMSYTTIMP